MSGRITGVAVDPTDANTIYISSAGGGVWKTSNGGSTWLALTDSQATLSMGAVAVAPSNRNVVYAGTGEANNSGDSNFGRGILVSLNGGATWTLQTGPAGVFNTRRLTTSKIAIDPTNPNIAYAAMADFGANGLYGTNTGIWKTTDGGATWTNTTQAAALNSSDPWSDVAIDPSSPLTVYAALGRYDGIAANGVYKSTNGGTTWSLITGFQRGTTAGRITLAIAKSNSQVVYVAAQSSSTFGLLSVIRSDDGGGTLFTTVSPPNYMGGQGWYDQWIVVDPSNAAIVYVAGAAGTNSILRSTTSGATWTDIHTGTTGTTPHVDHHGVDFDPAGKLIDGDDGGIYRLADPTTHAWDDLNGNLGTIQFQGIGLHPTDKTKALAGSQDNGTELFNNDLIWTEVDGGDGGWVKYSKTNTNRVYRISPVASFGASAFFRRSDNGGNSWVSKTTGLTNTGTFNFYAPFVVDPGNGDRVLTGGDRVFETTNGADSWTAISAPGVNGWTVSSSIDAIALAASNLNTVYAATGSHVFVTTNHGTTWTDHPLPVTGTVADLQVDPSNSSTAYAVVSAFTSGGNVFKTINGGTTWTNISGNLPNEPVWSIQLDPAAGAQYLGADDGVYETTNGGATWSRKGAGFPNVQVFQLEFNPTTDILAAATHGRGAWEILTPPTVVEFRVLFGSQTFNLLTSARTRLPWQITGIQVVFSRNITSASTASITGVNATAISGLGTNTITWTIDPLSNVTTIASLLGTGGSAIMDQAGTPIATFNQNVKVLWGDYNDDGVVNSQDLVGVNSQRSAPYNRFADMDGNGVVDPTDVNIVRSRVGSSNP